MQQWQAFGQKTREERLAARVLIDAMSKKLLRRRLTTTTEEVALLRANSGEQSELVTALAGRTFRSAFGSKRSVTQLEHTQALLNERNVSLSEEVTEMRRLLEESRQREAAMVAEAEAKRKELEAEIRSKYETRISEMRKELRESKAKELELFKSR